MNENIVCLDLMALYEHCKENKNVRAVSNPEATLAECKYCIILNEAGTEYYDLYRNENESVRLCCDGEQCKVLEHTEEYVRLVDVEDLDNEELEGIDTSFRLSIKEFEIAAKTSIKFLLA